MPELPEVETIRRQLTKFLPFTILSVSKSKHIRSILKIEKFRPNKKIINKISRYGKYIIFEMENNCIMLSHLGMSGAWLVTSEKTSQKHTHIQMKVLNEKTQRVFYLSYNDPRRFGNIYLFGRNELEKKLSNQGVDVSTHKLTQNFIKNAVERFPNKEIKRLLLDQKYFSGIGNYLASEICAHAGIRPDRLCSKIDDQDVMSILKSIKKVINQSVKYQGTTFQGGYRDVNGSKGEGVKNLVVFYQQICGLCGENKVTKIYLDKRGTYFCSKCQK